MRPTIPLLLEEVAAEHGELVAQMSKDAEATFVPITYAELKSAVDLLAAGLISIGVDRGRHVGLISENCREWLTADLAILSIGAIDVPRGVDSTDDEISYILSFAECSVVCVEDAYQAGRIMGIKDKLSALKWVVLLRGSADEQPELAKDAGRVKITDLAKLSEEGAALLQSEPSRISEERAKGAADDVATVIFTSGTTGIPKGVMLTHTNFLHQVKHVPELIHVGPGDIWLCVLPVWHSFERIMQYVSLGSASCLAYSKPIGRVMLEDFAKVRPTWMASVPRIWESLMAGIYRNIKNGSAIKRGMFNAGVSVGSAHAKLANLLFGRVPRFTKRNRVLDAILSAIPWLLLWPLKGLFSVLVFKKIRARLGGRFVAGISGGGALPKAVDEFFQAVGVLVLEGYGLTETGPVLGVRAQDHPVSSTVGPVFPGTEIRILDEGGAPLPPGHQGVVLAKGPQVMAGYYKRPEDTAAMISEDGWLNTGDLGMLTYDNELKITGRAKDTIVLLGGENIEPAPIEAKLRGSEFVDQAVLQGQDQKMLGVLIVPNREALAQFFEERGEQVAEPLAPEALARDEVQKLFQQIIREQVSAKTGFKSFETIGPFALISEGFTLGEELSQKQEVKRHVIAEKYKKEIAALFA